MLLLVCLVACSSTYGGDKFRNRAQTDGGPGGLADAAQGIDGHGEPACGDGVCGGESVCDCAADCGAPSCGDAICCPGLEDPGSCSEDCVGGCGDET